MYRMSDFTKQYYKVNEAAEILGVATKTIRNYDNRGLLKAERTVGNHRCISRDSLIRFLDEKGLIVDDTVKQRRDIVYARVSSHDQKVHGDLDRLTRFGFHYLETMFAACGTNIIVVKNENDEKSVQEELVDDMMSLIACFSGKLYGMRSRKTRREKGQGRNEKSKKS